VLVEANLTHWSGQDVRSAARCPARLQGSAQSPKGSVQATACPVLRVITPKEACQQRAVMNSVTVE